MIEAVVFLLLCALAFAAIGDGAHVLLAHSREIAGKVPKKVVRK